MTTLSLIIYTEIDICCILLVSYIAVKSFRKVERREGWRFYLVSLCFILQIITMDLIAELMEDHIIRNQHPLPYIVNTLYFVAILSASVYWLFFTEAELGIIMKGNTKAYLLISIPAFFLYGLLIANYFNGCLFYFDANDNFVRGPWNFFAFGIPMLYLVIASLHPLTRLFKNQYYVQRGNYFNLFLFAFITLAAGIVQIFVPGTPLPCIGMSAACLLVYMSNQELLISIDPLTKLNNRNQMIRYLDHKLSHVDSKNHLYLLLLDLDRFKQVNDTYGHVEGDRALIQFATILKQTAAVFNCFVARYGGDEFILIYESSEAGDVNYLREYIHARLRDYNEISDKAYELRTSIGCAEYNDRIRYVPDFISLADELLYKEKQKRL